MQYMKNSDQNNIKTTEESNEEPPTDSDSVGGCQAPAKRKTLVYDVINYGIRGVLFGSCAAILIEILIPGWVPITRFGMGTMLLINAIIGVITLAFQRSDLPLFVIIPAHLVCTLVICIAWICINGWQWHVFHEELALFIIGFILVYVVIWAGILAYYGFITSNINERLDVRARRNRKN